MKRKDAKGRAAAGVLSCHGTLSLPSSVGLLLLRWCGMLPTYASFVLSSLLFLTVLCLLPRILACVVWLRFTRNTRAAVPRLPTPEDWRSGEGQRLTPDAPHNSGRPPTRGDGPPPHHPRGTQPPLGMQAKGTVFGPDTHTPAPTARG